MSETRRIKVRVDLKASMPVEVPPEVAFLSIQGKNIGNLHRIDVDKIEVIEEISLNDSTPKDVKKVMIIQEEFDEPSSVEEAFEDLSHKYETLVGDIGRIEGMIAEHIKKEEDKDEPDVEWGDYTWLRDRVKENQIILDELTDLMKRAFSPTFDLGNEYLDSGDFPVRKLSRISE